LQSSGRLQGLPAAVADLGDRLYGDYTRSDPVDREMAKRLTQQALEALAGGERLSVAGGNAYALAYARVLSDIPLCSSGDTLLDEDVPFYAMVLHGYMEMSGAAVNYADDPQTAVLQAIEKRNRRVLPADGGGLIAAQGYRLCPVLFRGSGRRRADSL